MYRKPRPEDFQNENMEIDWDKYYDELAEYEEEKYIIEIDISSEDISSEYETDKEKKE